MRSENLIPDEWIVAYAAGTLSEAKATLVASHVSFHPELQKRVTLAEDIGGALLESAEKKPVSYDMFEKVSAMLDQPLPEVTAPVQSDTGKLMSAEATPAPLKQYIDETGITPKWRFMGPGLRQAKLQDSENGEKLWLLKARGGTEMPMHDHRGQELTLVLQGSYRVGDTRYGVGDMEIAAEDVYDHEPIIDEGEDCICLVVTEAPIKLKSMIARAAQPFIGI